MNKIDILDFYKFARQYVVANKLQNDIDKARNRNWETTNAKQFFEQFVYVIINTGTKKESADKLFQEFCDSSYNPNIIENEIKKSAIIKGLNQYTQWFQTWYSFALKNERSAIEYLETLPYIGKKTKYHLASLIGMDCAEPNKYTLRISKHFNWDNPRLMCEWLSDETKDKVAVISVVLTKYCELNPKEFASVKQEKLI